MKFIKYTILLVITSFVMSCSSASTTTLDGNEFAVILSEASRSASELVIFNEDWDPVDRIKLKAEGIFRMTKNDHGDLILPVEHDGKIITVTNDLKVTEEDTHAFPLYVEDKNEERVATYNTNMEYGTLEWTNSDEEIKQVEIEGNYLGTAIIIDDYVYATTSLIYDGGSHIELFQVDKENGDIIDKFKIEEPGFLPIIQDFSGQIIMAGTNSFDKQTMLITFDLRTHEIEYIYLDTLGYGVESLFQHDDYIYVVTGSENQSEVHIFTNNLEFVKKETLDIGVINSRLKDDTLITLSQGKDRGIINKYSLSTFELIKQTELEYKNRGSMRTFDLEVLQ